MLRKTFYPSSSPKPQKQVTLIGYLKVSNLMTRVKVGLFSPFISLRQTAKDDDIVKLYDLTSLCNDLNEDVNQNPFTTPVAMLLFK